jgi:Cu(I)/Ag(I) efflux system membrane fusion protein
MKRRIFFIFITLFTGIFIGWLFFHSSEKNDVKPGNSIEVTTGNIWTCAMHPQIRMDKPGKCPICGMELIPLVQNSSASIDPDAVHLSAEAAQLANVSTSVVTKQKPVKEVRLYGKVQADERLLQSQVAHVSGRIDKLAVNFTGESVVKGQVLAQIYSPELIPPSRSYWKLPKQNKHSRHSMRLPKKNFVNGNLLKFRYLQLKNPELHRIT